MNPTPQTAFSQFEHISTEIHDAADAACRLVAGEIAALIRSRPAGGPPAVLGLATGSTPVRLYRELIRMHREEDLSFANVITFNLDEYYGLGPDHPESYRRFMNDQLFDHVDIPAEHTHVPEGRIPRDEVLAYCGRYEQAIADHGGIDIQILGIGRTGHIGFNEPGSTPDSPTRLVTLDSLTRRDAARDFLGEENVPHFAITMGVGTILAARKVILLAWGEAKAPIISRTVEGEQTEAIPATFLQRHGDCVFHIDEAAASDLTRIQRPWIVGPVDWSPKLTRKAVGWLARTTGKPILKLVAEDYTEHSMADLLFRTGGAYSLNIEQFNVIQHTITGWPGGKPKADDSNRPERALPFPKRCLVLSPEPCDDVTCMGGTLHRLNNQGHAVTIAYQSSGNLAVPDDEVRRTTELIIDLGDSGQDQKDVAFARLVDQQLADKGAFGADTADIRKLKGLLRRSEARSSARTLGIGIDRLRFLDLPFYEEGRYRRFVVTDADIERMVALLDEVRPHQIFATGFGHDPLSVPALCFHVLEKALERLAGEAWLKSCFIWLYRGPGKEWETHEIDMAVPLSPEEFENKIQGIYQHQTQRNQRPGDPQSRSSNTWDLARQINRDTAVTYDALGMAEYEALECFRRWSP